MSQPAFPSLGAESMVSVNLPTLGTVPLGPDEPELFTNAMARILDHLGGSDLPPGRTAER